MDGLLYGLVTMCARNPSRSDQDANERAKVCYIYVP
jgi:hypothetical protein